jgi:hypothetical protein
MRPSRGPTALRTAEKLQEKQATWRAIPSLFPCFIEKIDIPTRRTKEKTGNLDVQSVRLTLEPGDRLLPHFLSNRWSGVRSPSLQAIPGLSDPSTPPLPSG